MKTNIHFESYLVQLFLEWEMFQKNLQMKSKHTHFVFNNFYFRKSCLVWNNVEKFRRAGHATDDNMAHGHCMLDTEGYKHTLSIY